MVRELLERNKRIRDNQMIETSMVWQRFAHYPEQLRDKAQLVMQLAHAPHPRNPMNQLPLELLGYLLDSLWLVSRNY